MHFMLINRNVCVARCRYTRPAIKRASRDITTSPSSISVTPRLARTVAAHASLNIIPHPSEFSAAAAVAIPASGATWITPRDTCSVSLCVCVAESRIQQGMRQVYRFFFFLPTSASDRLPEGRCFLSAKFPRASGFVYVCRKVHRVRCAIFGCSCFRCVDSLYIATDHVFFAKFPESIYIRIRG